MLVKKETDPAEMFHHLKEQVRTFPLHQQTARWQHEQFRYVTEHLPKDACICVHDFSENYKCSEKTELQTTYFQKTEVTIHVTVIHRHSILSRDGIVSTPETPIIRQEYLYVISPDTTHDQYFVHEVRRQVKQYLDDIGYSCRSMHEYTDGCPAQYKSRHCFGDISNHTELGYELFTRSFFETSHAKGPQDAAGGLLKRMADMAVLRGKCLIQDAEHLYKFAIENLESPKCGDKRRIFKYIETIDRSTEIRLDPVRDIRNVHHVRVHGDKPGVVHLTGLSCFTCNECAGGQYVMCENIAITGKPRPITMVPETKHNSDLDVEAAAVLEPVKQVVSAGHVVALFTEDPVCDFYLLKVTKPLSIHDKQIKDKWGAVIPANTEVFTGLYYENVGGNKYNLVNRPVATVPAAALLYLCSQIDGSDCIDIPADLHTTIMESVVQSKTSAVFNL